MQAIPAILRAYAKAIQAIGERGYQVSDVLSISCKQVIDYLMPADENGASLLGFVLCLDLSDGQQYQVPMKIQARSS